MIAVAPGSFQSELGCPGDWDPGCLRSWLEDPDGDGIYTFETTALAGGLVRDEGRDQRELGRELRRGRRPGRRRTSRSACRSTTRRSPSATTSTSHVLTITVATPRRPRLAGALSHFDLARKDCLGTARNTTSKVWYTVANGVLSDVYYPTVDNTNVETLQYIVTDGSTFTDLQTRDMTYTVEAVDDTGGMACKVTATAKSGKYTIETEYITDPSRNTVLMRVSVRARSKSGLPALRALRPDRERQRRRRPGQRRRRLGDGRPLDRPPGARLLRSRSRRRTRPTATTRSRSTPRSTAASRRPRAASSATRATGSSSSTPRTR